MPMQLRGTIVGLILGIVLCASGSGLASPPDGIIMIVHQDNTITSITHKETELIFLSKKRSWPDGTPITVVINENPAIYPSFSQSILKRSTRQYLIFRKKMLFRGQGIPPFSVKTDQDVIDFVTTHTNSIGYVSVGAGTSGIKILAISP